MDVKSTKAWHAAEWQYGALHADRMTPFLQGPLGKAEIIVRLRRIVRGCPEFYPATLELGLNLLSMKGSKRAEYWTEKGFRLLLDLVEPEHAEEQIDRVVGNLEELWRFDIARRLLALAVPRYPQEAGLLDSQAHAAARLGDFHAAQLSIGEALSRDPHNGSFWCNKGWFHLMAGELEEAERALRMARKDKPGDQTVRGNLRIHAYLSRHGGTYIDYLLRPLDSEKMDRLADLEQWEDVNALRAEYNDCRMEALAQSMLLEAKPRRWPLADLLATLRSFFAFVEGVDADGSFLHEDMAFVHRHFQPIMHKFIFKFADVDHELIEDTYEALTAYYRFLSTRGLVSPEAFRQFRRGIGEVKGELIHKVERYNAIRHDDAMDEDRKEAVREELFEGDHAWPHL